MAAIGPYQTCNTEMLEDPLMTDIVAKVEKLKPPKKSRESRSWTSLLLASLLYATTEVHDRFWMKRYGPLAPPAGQNASAALKIFILPPKKDFCSNIALRTDVMAGRHALD